MKNKLFKNFLGIVGLSVLLTGCYREEIAQLHNQIDAIEFREIVAQVDEMKSTVSEIQNLSNQLNALITPLTNMKQELEGQISTNKGDIDGLKNQLNTVNSTLNDLLGLGANISSLETRIGDLEKADYGTKIDETKKNLDEALKQLEGLAKIKSDIEKLQGETSEIPAIKQSIEDLKGTISQGIIDAISDSKDEIFKWISENLDIQGALSNYYTKAEIDAKVADVKDIAAIKTRLAGLGDEIKNAINSAIEGAFGNVEEFKQKVDGFGTEINKLWAAIGDLSKLTTEAKDNLVNAINELAAKVKASAGELDAYFDSTKVNSLLSGLESILTIAIQSGDKAVAANANGRIDSLCRKVLEITTAETGLIDSRIDAAIAALGDLVTSEDLAGFITSADIAGFITADDIAGFATQKELDSLKNVIGAADKKGTIIARIAALEAINVTIESKNYTSWAEAVKAVYDSLKSKVGNISAIQGDITGLTTRIKTVEDIIGNGDNYFTTTNTIAAAIKNLNGLVNSLATETSLRAAIDSLAGIHNALINALLGVSKDGKIADITSDNNLNALKARIDNFFSGTGVTSIKAAMDSLNKNINAVKAIIGGEYSSTNTVASAISALGSRIKILEDAGYGTSISGLQTDMQNLLNALAGKTTGGQISDVKSLITAINGIITSYNTFKIGSISGVEAILNDLNARLSKVDGDAGDVAQIKKELGDLQNSFEDFKKNNFQSVLSDLINYLQDADVSLVDLITGVARLQSKILTLTYIPYYSDGCATVILGNDNKPASGLTLEYAVTSPSNYDVSGLKSLLETRKRPASASYQGPRAIRGNFLKTITRAGYTPEMVEPDSVIVTNNKTILVYFSKEDITRLMPSTAENSLAVSAIFGSYDNSTRNYKAYYSSEYVPVKFFKKEN